MNSSAKYQDQYWSGRHQPIVDRHIAALSLVRQQPILDIGGGDGTCAGLLRQHGFDRLSVIDISAVAVDKLQRAGFTARVLDITATPLPFADDAFGTVLLLDVLEHIVDPLPVLCEAARIGHEIILGVPNFNHLRWRAQMVMGNVPYQNKPTRGGHVYWFNWAILRRLTAQANLEIEAVAHLNPRKGLPHAAWSWLGHRFPNLIPIGYVIRCRPKQR